MVAGTPPIRPTTALTFLAVASIVLLGLVLRLDDPLSSPVLPAEDPYNHMALVREHLRDGNLGPLYTGGELYPPGMHAFLAAVWVFTGADLFEIFRIGPAVLGAIGVLGVALLVGRWEGRVAGFVAGLAYAVAPEIVFRTTMMAPTAVDLAVLPFVVYAMLETISGRLWWSFVVAPLLLFLVFSHPWVITILGLASGVFLLAALAGTWDSQRGPRLSRFGTALVVALVGLAWALSLSGCGGACGIGFSFVFEGGAALGALTPVLAAGALVVAAAIAFAPFLAPVFERQAEPRLLVRGAACLLLAVGLVLATLPALGHMPAFVNLPRMLGWPILLAGALGFVLLPLLRTPLAYMGGALAFTTYPFVIYDPFNSPFWSHRTAVYLGLGLVLLAGAVTGAAVRLAEARPRRAEAPEPQRAPRPTRAVLVAVPGLLIALAFGGTVYAATPPIYPGWYRLFQTCEHEGLEAIAERANQEPKAIVIAGDWQAKLVVAAFATNATRIWFTHEFFVNPDNRSGVLSWTRATHQPVIVILDPYLAANGTHADAAPYEGDPWTPIGSWCMTHQPPLHGIRAYYDPGGTQP